MRNTLLTLVAFAALAAPLSAHGGSELKGKFYILKQCKPCHVEGKPGGVVTPLIKTQAQWKAYFKADKHNKGTEKMGAHTKLTPAQLKDVEAFMIAHASDSPQPMTCGG